MYLESTPLDHTRPNLVTLQKDKLRPHKWVQEYPDQVLWPFRPLVYNYTRGVGNEIVSRGMQNGCGRGL